jgi:hypothetical protein
MVALGKGAYKLLVRQPLAEGKVAKVTLNGKPEGDAINLSGKAGDVEWKGAVVGDSAIEGKISGGGGGAAGSFALKKVTRASPTLGAKPPAGAIVLLDGRNFDEVTKGKLKDGSEQEWKIVEEGAIQVPKGGMNTKKQFAGSIKVHIEFKNPLMPDKDGQGRGNSGVFLPNGEEIQVLDSFGMTTYEGGSCGGLYKYKNPDAFDEFPLASLPPGQWQTYDIEYRVELKDGKPTGKPKVTVFHNGIKIHDNYELKNNARAGGMNFQDHTDPVQYRNIWVLPLDGK